jgi:hypothetical protein
VKTRCAVPQPTPIKAVDRHAIADRDVREASMTVLPTSDSVRPPQNVISGSSAAISRGCSRNDGNISAAAPRPAPADRMSIHKMLHRRDLASPGRV